MNDAVWARTHKGDRVVREMADRHYTRQSPGAAMFTRPGYSSVLVIEDYACWVWWRPKWEDGRPGTSRKDGLKAIECTLFRKEASCPVVASELISSAVTALERSDVQGDLHMSSAGHVDYLLTAIGVEETKKRRGKKSLPGKCYRDAGWLDADPSIRPPLKGKIWLWIPIARKSDVYGLEW